MLPRSVSTGLHRVASGDTVCSAGEQQRGEARPDVTVSVRSAVFMLGSVRAFHGTWGQVAVWVSGLVGLWGVVMAGRNEVPRIYVWAVGLAIITMLVQVVIGVAVMSNEEVDPGNQHVFYGVLIAATFAFAYIYRAQFRKRPGLSYGLLLLFTMGLGIRGIMTFGVSF